jgi:hypothetical protein
MRRWRDYWGDVVFSHLECAYSSIAWIHSSPVGLILYSCELCSNNRNPSPGIFGICQLPLGRLVVRYTFTVVQRTRRCLCRHICKQPGRHVPRSYVPRESPLRTGPGGTLRHSSIASRTSKEQSELQRSSAVPALSKCTSGRSSVLNIRGAESPERPSPHSHKTPPRIATYIPPLSCSESPVRFTGLSGHFKFTTSNTLKFDSNLNVTFK